REFSSGTSWAGSSGQGVERVETSRELRTRLVVTLHRVVERALRVEQLDEARFSAPIGIRGGVTDVARLREHLLLDRVHELVRRRVLLPGAAQVAGDVGLERADARGRLARFLARPFDLALISVEEGQGRAEEQPPLVAAQRVGRELPVELGA